MLVRLTMGGILKEWITEKDSVSSEKVVNKKNQTSRWGGGWRYQKYRRGEGWPGGVGEDEQYITKMDRKTTA